MRELRRGPKRTSPRKCGSAQCARRRESQYAGATCEGAASRQEDGDESDSLGDCIGAIAASKGSGNPRKAAEREGEFCKQREDLRLVDFVPSNGSAFTGVE